MLSVSPATRIFVALSPVDMRKSFNGLYAYVQTVLAENPLTGHLFVFTNRLKNRAKVLYWDGSGLWVCAKRLEKGTFGWPAGEGASPLLASRGTPASAARDGGQVAPSLVSNLKRPGFLGLSIPSPSKCAR